MKVQLSAQLLKVESRADRTYKLIFNTQELKGEEAAKLLPLLLSQGWLLFSPTELEATDVPDYKPDGLTGQKSQAQRIRGALYRKWEQQGKKGDFETFYTIATERFIDQIKATLE
jgi:hypothetical protein